LRLRRSEKLWTYLTWSPISPSLTQARYLLSLWQFSYYCPIPLPLHLSALCGPSCLRLSVKWTRCSPAVFSFLDHRRSSSSTPSTSRTPNTTEAQYIVYCPAMLGALLSLSTGWLWGCSSALVLFSFFPPSAFSSSIAFPLLSTLALAKAIVVTSLTSSVQYPVIFSALHSHLTFPTSACRPFSQPHRRHSNTSIYHRHHQNARCSEQKTPSV
jgi:hypothetical protein